MKKYILYFLIVISVISCSKRIIRYEYDHNYRAYKLYLTSSYWIIARDIEGKKIIDLDKIEELVNNYNQKSFDIYQKDNWKLDQDERYEIADLYYNGLYAYKEKKYKAAIQYFNQAISKNIHIA